MLIILASNIISWFNLPYIFFNFCSKELTWRDVQHLIAMSSDNKMKVKENDWIKNGAGFKGTK